MFSRQPPDGYSGGFPTLKGNSGSSGFPPRGRISVQAVSKCGVGHGDQYQHVQTTWFGTTLQPGSSRRMALARIAAPEAVTSRNRIMAVGTGGRERPIPIWWKKMYRLGHQYCTSSAALKTNSSLQTVDDDIRAMILPSSVSFEICDTYDQRQFGTIAR